MALYSNKATGLWYKSSQVPGSPLLSTSNSNLQPNTSQPSLPHQASLQEQPEEEPQADTSQKLSTNPHIAPCATKESFFNDTATTERKAGSAIATATDADGIVESTSKTARSEGTATIAKHASEPRGTASPKAPTSSDTNRTGGSRDKQPTDGEPGGDAGDKEGRSGAE
ncbi:MAG: hypothetical protein Q9187_006228 [Circinaria calcarea]